MRIIFFVALAMTAVLASAQGTVSHRDLSSDPGVLTNSTTLINIA